MNKSIEIIKQLLEDFDIEIDDIYTFQKYQIKGISDIGHSSKRLSLEVNE